MRLFFQVIVILVTTIPASLAISHLTAERYSQNTPPRYYPLVALAPTNPTSEEARYELLYWRNLKEERAKNPELTFRLPEPSGGIVFDPELGYGVFFDAETRGDRQYLEVFLKGDDFHEFAEYTTDGAEIWPTYYRRWGYGHVALGLFSGLVVAAWLGRLICP